MDIFPLLIFRRWYVWNGLFRIRSGFPCFRFRKLPKPARRCPDFLFSGAVCSRSASNTAAQSCCLTAWSDRLPSDKTHPLHLAFSLAFYLDRGQLILAADEQTLPALQSLLFPEEPLDTSDVFHLFFSFLESLIQEDMLYLQNFEKRLATIEESLLDTLPKELQRTLITIRRELLVFHAYYQQLLDMCEILSEDENHFLPPECARQFSRLGNRVDRLYDHTQMLREYALQIREMQQAQIDLRQNDTMRILTVISTIFFPLSLIAGWYGMNFTHMPELSAPYAYFILIGVCILIVAVEIWYFKKKGWF